MKKIFLLTCIAVIFQNANSQNKVTEITIEKTENKTIINKHIYGHFAEHLGRCIYGGLYVEKTVISQIQKEFVMI